MRRTGESFKQVVNETLRLGLVAAKQPRRKPIRCQTLEHGARLRDKASITLKSCSDYLEGRNGGDRCRCQDILLLCLWYSVAPPSRGAFLVRKSPFRERNNRLSVADSGCICSSGDEFADCPGFRRSSEDAARVVDQWLQQPNVRVLVPGDRHWPLFRQMIIEGQASGPLVSDAELAALTIEYGGVLYTADRDFARFPGLRWVNPLEG